GTAVLLAQRQRTAGHQPGGDAAGDVLQFVAVLIAGDEGEHDDSPGAEIARQFAQPLARAEQPGADDEAEQAEPDELAEMVVLDAQRAAGRIVEDEQDQGGADQAEDEPEAAPIHALSPRSRAMRARRVSRRGLRSTVSSRAGS